MYKTSGHLPYYAESMFPPMELRELPDIDARYSENEAVIQERRKELFKKHPQAVLRLAEGKGNDHYVKSAKDLFSELSEEEYEYN